MATLRVTLGQREEMMSDSSSPVSTPQSPESGHLSPTTLSNVATVDVVHVGGFRGGVATNGNATTSAKPTTTSDIVNVIKRQRKNKDVDGAQDAEAKEKKPRKPRAPKDPNAPSNPRKKRKPSHEAINTDSAQEASRQGNSEAIQNSFLANARASQTTPRPASSGQLYDPVRSTTIEPHVSHSPCNAPAASPLKLVSRTSASASPAIARIIDPPPTIPKTTDNSSSSLHVAQNQLNAFAAPTSASQPATHGMQSPFAARTSSSAEIKASTTSSSHTSDMDIDKPTAAELNASTLPTKKTSSNGTSPAPKQPRQKEPPPPLPLGSGLLSNDLFGGPPSFSSSTAGTETPTIVITVPLLGETNKYVNFAQEAEKKYGFNALYPRLAAHRERQARIAAASAALEKGSSANGTNTNSGDEMSLDNSEGESDREGAGGAGDGSGPDGVGGAEVVKKRKKRTEGYDKEDDFIDDTELIWEEQAAASKDGFFVYSGPLVREGEKAAVERADGTVKRGRGRGRGSTRGEGASTRGSRGDGTSTRGSKGGGAGTSTRGARGEGTSTRGTRGGRGSRGGAAAGTTRGSPATARGSATAGSRGSGILRKPRVSSTDADIEASMERARQKVEVDAALERALEKTKWARENQERDARRVGMDMRSLMTDDRKGAVLDVVMSDRAFGGGMG